MTSTHVLRIPQSEDEDKFVLVRAIPSGSKPLDLKLEGTEGEARYATKLKQDKVSSLRVKNCSVSESEWNSILEAFFSQLPVDDIRASATVQTHSSIVITLRKQVQGITQRLGAISLAADETEEIELLDWCAASAAAVVAGNAAASEAEAKAKQLESAVEDLKSQLEELVQAKSDDETALLRKFRDLLNEKKIKIREQQKVLAAASFNTPQTATAADPESEPKSVSAPAKRGRKPAQSRAGKRKATPSVPKEESEDEEEAVDEPRIKSEPEDTDGHSTEDTASVADDDDSDEEMDDDPAQEAEQRPSTAATQKKAPNQPPPRRDLPFINKKPAEVSKPANSTTTAAAEDTDSDDEL